MITEIISSSPNLRIYKTPNLQLQGLRGDCVHPPGLLGADCCMPMAQEHFTAGTGSVRCGCCARASPPPVLLIHPALSIPWQCFCPSCWPRSQLDLITGAARPRFCLLGLLEVSSQDLRSKSWHRATNLITIPGKSHFSFWSQSHLPLRPLCWKQDGHYQVQLSSHMALLFSEPPEGHSSAKGQGETSDLAVRYKISLGGSWEGMHTRGVMHTGGVQALPGSWEGMHTGGVPGSWEGMHTGGAQALAAAQDRLCGMLCLIAS